MFTLEVGKVKRRNRYWSGYCEDLTISFPTQLTWLILLNLSRWPLALSAVRSFLVPADTRRETSYSSSRIVQIKWKRLSCSPLYDIIEKERSSMYQVGSVGMKKPHACTIKSTGKKASRWGNNACRSRYQIKCSNCDHVVMTGPYDFDRKSNKYWLSIRGLTIFPFVLFIILGIEMKTENENMALTAGIVGLQTLVNQHYLIQCKAGASTCIYDYWPKLGMVEVPDERLQNWLNSKTVPTTFGFTDIAEIVKELQKEKGWGINSWPIFVKWCDCSCGYAFDDENAMREQGRNAFVDPRSIDTLT